MYIGYRRANLLLVISITYPPPPRLANYLLFTWFSRIIPIVIETPRSYIIEQKGYRTNYRRNGTNGIKYQYKQPLGNVLANNYLERNEVVRERDQFVSYRFLSNIFFYNQASLFLFLFRPRRIASNLPYFPLIQRNLSKIALITQPHRIWRSKMRAESRIWSNLRCRRTILFFPINT